MPVQLECTLIASIHILLGLDFVVVVVFSPHSNKS